VALTEQREAVRASGLTRRVSRRQEAFRIWSDNMPRKPKKPCAYPGCPELVEPGQSYCEKHRKLKQRQVDKKRGTSAERGYNARWRKARKMFLKRNPLCEECKRNGKITPATVVDHIIPHKGDMNLFWDESNWQALCKTCHDRKTVIENGGFGNIELYPKELTASRIPLIIVCGPPGSGKITYVQQNKGVNDLVIDLDEIKTRLSGLPLYQADDRWLKPAIDERNKLLRRLSTTYDYNRAWFIVGAPSRMEREFWRNTLRPEKVVVLETPERICIERIRNDERREHIALRQIDAVRKWWAEYQRSEDDVIICEDG